MANIPCTVEPATVETGTNKKPTAGVRVTCSRCQHHQECSGTSIRSARRAAVMLRDSCPAKEKNFYVVPPTAEEQDDLVMSLAAGAAIAEAEPEPAASQHQQPRKRPREEMLHAVAVRMEEARHVHESGWPVTWCQRYLEDASGLTEELGVLESLLQDVALDGGFERGRSDERREVLEMIRHPPVTFPYRYEDTQATLMHLAQAIEQRGVVGGRGATPLPTDQVRQDNRRLREAFDSLLMGVTVMLDRLQQSADEDEDQRMHALAEARRALDEIVRKNTPSLDGGKS